MIVSKARKPVGNLDENARAVIITWAGHGYTVTSRPTRVYGEKSHHMARFLTI